MMMMLSMVEVSPKRRYQVRQVSQPVGLITGNHWCDSPSPPARRPPRDNPRPLSTVFDARVAPASPELSKDLPVPLELTRRLSNSAPELVTASETERLTAMYLAGREGKRTNRRTQVIGVDEDEETREEEEGVYSKLNHHKIAGLASERRKFEELRCSPESQYSSLNVIQDRSSETCPINDYSYIDIDIISDKNDTTSSQQSSQDLPGHNYFVLEIPEDQEEEPSVEKEVARKTENKGRIQPKTTSNASNIKTTKAGNQINSYVDVNLCKLKPSAKDQKKLQQPIKSEVSEYERPIRATETPQRPRGYKPIPVQIRLTDRAGSPQVLDDNVYSEVYLPRDERVTQQQQQRRPFSPLPALPTSSHTRSFQMSPHASPPKMLPSSPRLSPSPPLISPRLASQRSSPMSPISTRSPFSPSQCVSPTPSSSHVSSPKTPSPQNSSPSRSRHYSSSSMSRRDCSISSAHFKRGGCYSSQKLKGERIYCNNTDHRAIGDDSTHSNHVNIIITENGPVLLSNKESPTPMTGGNGDSKTGGSSVDSLSLEEGHYEFDPNFVRNIVQRS